MTQRMDAVSKLWTQMFPDKDETPRPFCAVCEQDFYGEVGLPLIEVEDSHPVPLVCPFCAVGVEPARAVPLVSDSVLRDDLAFAGAWDFFADALLQWELNARADYQRLKFEVNEKLPAALHLWVNGSLLDDETQADTLRALWPLLSYERTFARLDAAFGLVEFYRHNSDVAVVREAVRRPELAPCWSLWWATQEARMKPRDWHYAGERHLKDCRAFAGGDDE